MTAYTESLEIFAQPKADEVIRLHETCEALLTPEQAESRLNEWREHAITQGETNRFASNRRVVLSLFDHTGVWSQPWVDAGYDVYRFDIQDCPDTGDVSKFSAEFFADWFGHFDGEDIYAILAACPCTDFAGSGARHFAAKDADGRTEASIELVRQTLRLIEFYRPAIWAIENPVGRIESLCKLPRWRLSFDPCHVGHPYTKKTLLWGRFNANLPTAPVEPVEGSKMHSKYGGSSLATKNARSVTPEGFALSFFMANNADDHPAIEVTGKFDRLPADLLTFAVTEGGMTTDEVTEIVEDFYYFELDDEGAASAVIEALQERGTPFRAVPQADTTGQLLMPF